MRIEPLEKDQADAVARAVYDELERRSGRVPNFFKMLGHKPAVLRTFLAFYQTIWEPGALSPKLKELAYLRTSILNGCTY